MCEPYHSIVQYPEDFDDSHFSDIGVGNKLKLLLGHWGKKIDSWFHISKMGAGHSLATSFGVKQLGYLPPSIDYEGEWWYKNFKLDMPLRFKNNVEAYEAAKKYHERVCIGDIQKFRRFLETSLRKSVRPKGYLTKLPLIFNSKGQDLFYNRVLVRKKGGKLNESIIKTIMGFTRKRNLFIPEWCDDNTFWKVCK